MLVKVNGKKLHLTTFEIPTSPKNIRKCLTAQEEFAKAQEAITNVDTDNNESVINSLDAQVKLIDTYVNFLQSVLHLSDKQADKLEDADFSDVVDFANEIMAKVLDFDANKSDKPEDK